MIWQAYLDESFDDEFFVLAGYISTAEEWAIFAEEWEALLPYATLMEDNSYQFKMSAMALSGERLQRVQAFYNVIFRHVYLGISIVVHQSTLKNVRARALVRDILSGEEIPIRHEKDSIIDNIYLLSFSHLARSFSRTRRNPLIQRLLPVDAKVDFIFDRRSESRLILEGWDSIVQDDTVVSSLFNSTPRFEDDREFLPLQAADFLAWWVRKWSKDGDRGPNQGGVYPWGAREDDMFSLNYFLREDTILENMANTLAADFGEQVQLIDRSTGERVRPTPMTH